MKNLLVFMKYTQDISPLSKRAKSMGMGNVFKMATKPYNLYMITKEQHMCKGI